MKKKVFFILSFFLILLAVLWFFLKKDASDTKPKNVPVSIEMPQEKPKEAKRATDKDSILSMAQREYNGSDLKIIKTLEENEFYTRHSIIYKSEGLVVSGILNVPVGVGPFPVLVLNHGYIEPKNYVNGQGLRREQDFFARHGYVVLHSDYRGYGFSDPDPDGDIRPRSGYVEDVLNAIGAIKKSNFDFFDKENIGMLGHSMGGGIALNIMVTKPSAAKAYALLAPINSDYRVNFKKWVEPDKEFDGIAERFYEKYGTYEENTELWESFSAKNYLDRVESPVMLHQGTEDDQVPVEWSRELSELLKKNGKDITYYEYSGEGHTFYGAQDLVMQRTLNFFDSKLKNIP